MNYEKNKLELTENGYSVTTAMYSKTEISQILSCIESSEQSGELFLKTKDLFAIRQLIISIPELTGLLFNEKLSKLLEELFQTEYFLTKAIYFDKPIDSNWFVAYHQDLSISVDSKAAVEKYTNWTFKKGQYGVQPPIHILENTVTVRIHLDDTDEQNGALKVIPKSHLQGIIRNGSEHWKIDNEQICKVEKGGAMLMKPLTLHASNRTTNGKKRRVIHLEFNTHELAKPLHWLEYWTPISMQTNGYQ